MIFQMDWIVTLQAAAKLPLARCLGTLALLVHLSIKFGAPIIRKLDALFIRLLGTQLHRKTKRIIQHKQLFASQAVVDILLHLPETFAQCLAESFFLFDQHSDDTLAVFLNLWKIRFVQIGNYWHHFLEEILLNPQVKTIANRPAQQAAHHVALFLITRHAAVNRQKYRRPKVIGDHSH